METTKVLKKAGGEGGQEKEVSDGSTGSSRNDNSNSSNSNKSCGQYHKHSRSVSYGGDKKGIFEYFGWVYHIGVNSISHEYCHLRFLFIKGKYVEMYKRDPHENPGIRPIRNGVIGPTLMVEELWRRKVRNGIACSTAGEARKWMEAFDHAKQQYKEAEYELSRGGSTRNKLNMEADIDLEGHRPRVRRYAHGLKKLIRIGQSESWWNFPILNEGLEMFLRQTSNLAGNGTSDGYFEGEFGDAIEAHEWKCVRTINGVRIFEDVDDSKSGKGALTKAVALVDTSADTVFEVILNLDCHKRYEWDMLTGDLELIDSYDGHYDVVYGTYDPKYLTHKISIGFYQAHPKFALLIDGNPSEILSSLGNGFEGKMEHTQFFNFLLYIRSGLQDLDIDVQKSICQLCFFINLVSGLKEYIGANPSLNCECSTMVVQLKLSDVSTSSGEFEDVELQDEFYDDAIAGDSSSSSGDEESEDDADNTEKKIKLKNVSWAISSLALKRASAPDANKELILVYLLSMLMQVNSMVPSTKERMRRTQISGLRLVVMGADPLLKLIAVDWFKVDKATGKIALHPRSLVQMLEKSFHLSLLLISRNANLEIGMYIVDDMKTKVPAKPNYSLLLYYAAERPVNKNSLLGKFVDGTDMSCGGRFKLIASIVEGYWMVKRAVGTKACLLGKAVTCKYFRQDNFLEAKEDEELPQYILSTV
ncbi:hypothetical protein CRYUN_Cryun02cG0052900 [Craigia yunnanensis]